MEGIVTVCDEDGLLESRRIGDINEAVDESVLDFSYTSRQILRDPCDGSFHQSHSFTTSSPT